MIKLIVLLIFITLLIVVAHDMIQEDKLKQIDELIARGIDPEEAFRKVYGDEG